MDKEPVNFTEQGYTKTTTRDTLSRIEYANNTWYKVNRTFKPSCKLNNHVQFTIKEFGHIAHNETLPLRYEISVVHESLHSEWIKVMIYALSQEEIIEKLDELENRLLKMWVVANE